MELCPYCEMIGTLPCSHIAISEVECPLCLGYGFVSHERMAQYLTIIGYAHDDASDEWQHAAETIDNPEPAHPVLFEPGDWK